MVRITGPSGETMPRKFSVLFWMLLISITTAVAGEWWEEKSFTEWSVEQVDTILRNSPWAVLSPAAPPITFGDFSALYVPSYYQVRLLTARPIREGMLQLISLGMCSPLDMSGISECDISVEKNRERLQEFLQSHPNDVRVKGDEQHIIMAVTLKQAVWSRSPVITTVSPDYLRELTNADQLSIIDASKVYADTNLTTNDGRRIALLNCVPPGSDQLGVKFYFPRHLADGTPIITAKDNKLVFETCINDTKIRVRFDLKKMLYRGKLEI
jgi:hypothetical protein